MMTPSPLGALRRLLPSICPNNNLVTQSVRVRTHQHVPTAASAFIRAASSDSSIKRTPLHDFHVAQGAKMVPFAGFSMPVSYPDLSHPASHLHTREHVSIFDVSHMLQTHVTGSDAVALMESMVVADVVSLEQNQGTLTLFTREEDGGIIDDLIVSKINEDFLYVVSNAGCIDKDWAHMKAAESRFKSEGKNAKVEAQSRGLIAVQGPGVAKVLQPVVDFDFSELTFMRTTMGTVCGIAGCRITRCGYTGEDGVEISIPSESTVAVTESLLSSKEDDVRLAGLGARDSLRLEAGLCLYGNDIDETTTPTEATLAWTIGKRRRQAKDFPGAELILRQLAEKPKRKRVGFVSSGAPARAGTPILDLEDNVIGHVTSGCPSPCLKKNVSMGYVDTKFSKLGTELNFSVRKKKIPTTVTKMPFVKANYYNG